MPVTTIYNVMKPGIQLRTSQQLSLTPQLQQAIRLLQLSQLELQSELRELTEANPLIDLEATADEDGDWAGPADPPDADKPVDEDGFSAEDSEYWDEHSPQVVEWGKASRGFDGDEPPEPQDAAPEDLGAHLAWQANLSGYTAREHAIALALIDALNEDGYLRDGLDPVLGALKALDPPVSRGEVEAVRVNVQGFDPVGVASLDLAECLAVQIQQLETATPGRELARAIVTDHLDLLAKREFGKLARTLHAAETEISAAAALIRTLDPRPGAAFDPTPAEYVAPDAYAVKIGGRWRVSLSPDCQPKLALNRQYCDLISSARRSDASWLRGQLQEARWLMKSLQARADTLYKVAQAIVRSQRAFLDFGPEAMKPLVMRELAEELDMHESTISRVTTHKYLHTPRGTYEFKYFFSSSVGTEDGGSVSARAIEAMIGKLVGGEDPRKPLSDQALAMEVNRQGIRVARRTVAKYRERLRIPSSTERLRAR
jgi:RNA polymerase sigma-54 factor